MRSMVERDAPLSEGFPRPGRLTAGDAAADARVSRSTTLRAVPLSQNGEGS
jgi:hypothetical protein